jgi:hypothetical protein
MKLWQFWQPRHTVASVARRLADGFADGSVVFGDAQGRAPVGLALTLDVPGDLSDDEVLERVKRVAATADSLYRSLGGRGLRIQEIEIRRPEGRPAEKVRLGMVAAGDEHPTALAAVREQLAK